MGPVPDETQKRLTDLRTEFERRHGMMVHRMDVLWAYSRETERKQCFHWQAIKDLEKRLDG